MEEGRDGGMEGRGNKDRSKSTSYLILVFLVS